MTIVENTDSRAMQPLPWQEDLREDGKCVNVKSASGKVICSFWGGDTREHLDISWPTEAQMKAHAAFAMHACNWFGTLQLTLEKIYNFEGCPAEIKKLIEEVMQHAYYERVPLYVRG